MAIGPGNTFTTVPGRVILLRKDFFRFILYRRWNFFPHPDRAIRSLNKVQTSRETIDIPRPYRFAVLHFRNHGNFSLFVLLINYIDKYHIFIIKSLLFYLYHIKYYRFDFFCLMMWRKIITENSRHFNLSGIVDVSRSNLLFFHITSFAFMLYKIDVIMFFSERFETAAAVRSLIFFYGPRIKSGDVLFVRNAKYQSLSRTNDPSWSVEGTRYQKICMFFMKIL